MAPEIVARHTFNANTTDIWACGVVFYAMVCGYLPFDGNTKHEIFAEILNCSPHIPSKLSESTRLVISSILQKSPGKRKSIKQILTMINNFD